MGWRAYLLLACFALAACPEVVDRLALVVGQQVLTELQLDEEIRVTAFLNRQPVLRDPAARRAAADRLVQQMLVKREMDLSHYPLPEDAEVNEYLKGIQRQQGLNASGFTQALSEYELTEETLKDHLALQLTTLRFIQYRFQPEIDVPETAIINRYKAEIVNWKAHHGGPPPTLEQSKDSIREALLEERTDNALNAWIEEARKRVNIRYLDKSLQ
jgi:hypothetical protein